MKAIVVNHYGDSSELTYVQNQPLPDCGSKQVLIKVEAAGVNPLDWKIRNGELDFLLRSSFPIVLGNDVCGTVVKVGSKVVEFSAGDKVFCMVDSNKKKACHGFAGTGGYAEYVVTTDESLCIAPRNLTAVQAAAVPLAALTAYQSLVKKGKITAGQKVLINGASGGVGSFAVQIAKAYGAEVTAVARDEKLLSHLGADHTINYRNVDFVRENKCYDIVFDVVSNRTFNECKQVLTPQGTFISNIASLSSVFFPLLHPLYLLAGFRKRYFHSWVRPSGRDLSIIRDMIEDGKIKPLISTVLPLKQAKLAQDLGEEGKQNGKIVLEI